MQERQEREIQEGTGYEQRQRRSEEPLIAIGFQLDQIVADFRLYCAVIVDDEGRVLAQSPEGSTGFIKAFIERLPAMEAIPEAHEYHYNHLRVHWPDLQEDQVATCIFRAGGRRLYIGAVGPDAVMNQVAIFRGITGTRRIAAS